MKLHAQIAGRCLALALLAAAAPAAGAAGAVACPAPLERWTEIDLYFGRNIANVGEVSEEQFRTFLANQVTPLFPDGLSVIDVAGQFRSGGRVVREQTKLLVLLVPDAAAARNAVASVVSAYKSRFQQQSVLRTETAVCLAFD